MAARYPVITRHIAEACAPAGFDLVTPLPVGRYNRAVAAEYQLPDFGRAEALAVLIGNTRALWPAFRAAVRADPALARDPDPLDRYTRERIGAAMSVVDARRELRLSYEAPPRRVAMQRLAHIAGLAYLSPTHLSIHSVYGPWIALRAVVVVDVPGPAGEPPVLASPCQCETGCMPRFQRAMAAAGAQGPRREDIEDSWRQWLAIRDACPVGREYRYTDEQIRYHYTKDKTLLTAP